METHGPEVEQSPLAHSQKQQRCKPTIIWKVNPALGTSSIPWSHPMAFSDYAILFLSGGPKMLQLSGIPGSFRKGFSLPNCCESIGASDWAFSFSCLTHGVSSVAGTKSVKRAGKHLPTSSLAQVIIPDERLTLPTL